GIGVDLPASFKLQSSRTSLDEAAGCNRRCTIHDGRAYAEIDTSGTVCDREGAGAIELQTGGRRVVTKTSYDRRRKRCHVAIKTHESITTGIHGQGRPGHLQSTPNQDRMRGPNRAFGIAVHPERASNVQRSVRVGGNTVPGASKVIRTGNVIVSSHRDGAAAGR